MRDRFVMVGLGLLALCLWASQPARAAAPSFDCSKATQRAERLTCSNDSLVALDVQMADAFARAIHLASVDTERLKSDQRLWLQVRNSSCRPPYVPESDAASCMAEVYRGRIAFLADPKYCSLKELDNCPNINRVPGKELNDILGHFLAHEPKGAVIGRPNENAHDAIMSNLGGPPDDVALLSDGLRLYSACRPHSCTEKAAVVFGSDGTVRGVAALEYRCQEMSCVDDYAVTVFLKADSDRTSAGSAIESWANAAVAGSYVSVKKPTLAQVEVRIATKGN